MAAVACGGDAGGVWRKQNVGASASAESDGLSQDNFLFTRANLYRRSEDAVCGGDGSARREDFVHRDDRTGAAGLRWGAGGRSGAAAREVRDAGIQRCAYTFGSGGPGEAGAGFARKVAGGNSGDGERRGGEEAAGRMDFGKRM